MAGSVSVSTPVADGEVSLTVGGLLDWLNRLETEGKQRIEDSGRLGLELVAGEAIALESYVATLAGGGSTDPGGTFAAYPVDPAVADDHVAQLDSVAAQDGGDLVDGVLTFKPELGQSAYSRPVAMGMVATLTGIIDRLRDMRNPAEGGPVDEALIKAANMRADVQRSLAAPRSDKTSPKAVVIDGGSGWAGPALSLDRQVKRAMTVVLGQTVPSDPRTLGALVRQRFTAGGTAPGLQLSPTTLAGGASDFAVLPPDQIILLDEARSAISDAKRHLTVLTADDCSCEPIAFEQARAGIAGPLAALMVEFGREDGPRDKRVRLYFDSVDAAVNQLEDSSSVDLAATNPEREELDVRYRLVVRAIRHARWVYEHLRPDTTSLSYVSARVISLLSVIGETTRNLADAMDGAGVSLEERRFVSVETPSQLLTRIADDDDVSDELDDLSTFLNLVHEAVGSLPPTKPAEGK
jgi:hypothetical protein